MCWVIVGLCADAAAQSRVRIDWVQRYNGPGNGVDRPAAMQIDDSGNIIVAGTSYGGDSTDDDYVLLKYTATGNLVWEKRYDWPGNDYFLDDGLSALWVDDSGFVYVTGMSWGTGTGMDYATLKYAPDGDLRWQRRYDVGVHGWDIARAIYVDDSGNVYVAGDSDGGIDGTDLLTLKYASDGTLLWERRWDGLGHCTDYAFHLLSDTDQYVYAVGTSTDASGNQRQTTVKYDPEGTLIWDEIYEGPSGLNWPNAVVIVRGHLYITGSSHMGPSWWDYCTLKYDLDGNLLWDRYFNGPASQADEAHSLGVDSNDNVYISGISRADNTWDDYATLKYDSSGVLLWDRRYNSLDSSYDAGRALQLDQVGNLYVVGRCGLSDTLTDIVTLSYDSEGNLLWERRYDGPASGDDDAGILQLDPEGNIYVTGRSWGGDNTDYDIVTIKYVPCAIDVSGDVNVSGTITSADIIHAVNYVFKGGPPPLPCEANGDVNCSGACTSADVIYLVNHVFKGDDSPCDACESALATDCP